VKRHLLQDLTGGTFIVSHNGASRLAPHYDTPIPHPSHVVILALHRSWIADPAVNGPVLLRPMRYVALITTTVSRCQRGGAVPAKDQAIPLDPRICSFV